MNKDMEFNILIGKTLSKIENINDEELVFTTADNEVYKLYHDQECCEGVSIEEVHGDFSDLIGTPILIAEEIIHEQDINPEGVRIPEYQDSFTWTFYNIATSRGHVTIRWYGESNGYYSESVDFCRIK